MRHLGLSVAVAAGLLLAGCAFHDDRYDGGRYRYGGYSAADQQGGLVRRSRGYSTGEAENEGLLAKARGGRDRCDDDAEVCYKNGRPDVSDTRDRFGRRAARRVENWN